MHPDPDPEPSQAALADLLLVDATAEEGHLVRRALRELRLDLAIHEAASDAGGLGVVVDRLGGRPAIVIVDGEHGAARALAAVRQVRSRRELACAPVVVLGEFENVDEVVQLLRQGADSAVVKPTFIDLRLRTLREVLRYWTHLAVLPPAHPTTSDQGRELGASAARSESPRGVATGPAAR